jgi:phosphatidylinositol glycan class W
VTAFYIDWLLNCVGPLAALTVYASSPGLLNLLVLLPAIFSFFPGGTTAKHTKVPAKATKSSTATKDASPANGLPRKPCVSMYRGSMMVITCVAILGVDFPIFPRRFAKVENWGTSLMDLGVGSFVFSAGVISARGLLKTKEGSKTGFLPRLIEAFRQSLALLGLGFIRLLSVKGVDYVEHITEYGVHWNFFFTLGFLPPFVAIFQSLFAFIPSYPLLALILATTYEVLLHFTSLTAYIITAPRANLISQNREGLFSFIGYLAIFLAGQGAGLHILPREKVEKSKTGGDTSTWKMKLKAFSSSMTGKLLISGLTYSALFILTTSYDGLNLRVSRRLANLPYVLSIASYNCLQLVVLVLTEKFFFPNVYKSASKEEEDRRAKNATSPLLAAFNRNGLAIFLLANLLTGAVNLALPTISMKGPAAMGVLTAYMAILGGVAVGLDKWNIDIKI